MPALPSPDEAERRILGHLRELPVAARPLGELAGATLAEDIRAERDQPPFDRVTMDGIAIAFDDWRAGQRRFRVAGTQAAGRPPLALAPGTCLEAMTGAILPAGSDCVIPVERLAVADGWARVEDAAPVERFGNVHARGLDARAGDRLLAPGTRLGAAELAVLASAGRAAAAVRAEPRIAVISTGDELVDPGAAIEDWQVRRSNPYALQAALALRGHDRVSLDHLPDALPAMCERLGTHLAARDVLVLSGGVSMGRFDLVPQALRELGVTECLHRIAQRPGKPLWFGVGPAGQAVFGLPGNPVSALVCLVRYVLPALAVLAGRAPPPPERVALADGFRVQPALWYFLPVQLENHPVHGRCARPRPTRGSGDFVSLLGTDGFVELPPGPAQYAAGHVASLFRW